jgi:hypothetical protein
MKGGYALDMRGSGFGLVPLAYHATALYTDPVTDKLYMVLDENNEPTDDMLPLASTAPTPNGTTIYEFNGDETSNMVYRWKSKLYELSRPAAFQWGQIRAGSYRNTVARFYREYWDEDYEVWVVVLLRELVITSQKPFRLPPRQDYDKFWWEVISTDPIETVQVSETVEELT